MNEDISLNPACAGKECPGEIDLTTEVQVGCDGVAFPCDVCGRLHTASGKAINGGSGVFFRGGVITTKEGAEG